ncbi:MULTISPECIES: peptide chain release factor 2 [unclassified Oceanispirochaeta]|uniref:peptide chain release factor 2 n=1 Tax=unclassified Oceanispirochaeta TaxID=2635722 RepID=UPI000E090CD1|nr:MULTISPECIES: peptide chain release factor 2 [unclassified Oceanispirochaeta]MBF9015651.1 peptide chain release factor 2 [Oceanispirochaeta sp. M2]NPD73425.1 peptide chain release factor 2 [Oceanispirochaeta sp. M1]RDG30898.1 peptide chain release factor 2 [Oceanispirochaeta sp. M1]
MLSDISTKLKSLDGDILDTWRRLDTAELKNQAVELEKESGDPNFWNDRENAETKLAQLKRLKNKFEPWEKLVQDLSDVKELFELAVEEGDESLESEIQEQLTKIADSFSNLNSLELLSEETDVLSAFITIHSGAGGTEACDWTSMLYRMYSRWIERKKYKITIMDTVEAEGGIKSISFQVDGDYSYGYLKGEGGIHRLVRISPFDSNARRHTSFASVYVSPVIDDSIDVDIKPDDIRVDTYRASGSGGQHVNKTSSAVRMTHIETGIVVQCQNQRSQLKNRDSAMKMLKSRLYEYLKQKQEEEKSQNAAEKKDIGWGSQIRSYVFHPYTMVKDLRTRQETGNIQNVMDGDIDQFIDAYLKYLWSGNKLE